MEKKILAYLLRVDEETGQKYQGYFAEVENTQQAKEAFVDGGFSVVHFTDEIDIIYGVECLVQGKPLNRVLYDLEGKYRAAFLGNLMVVRREGEGYSSIKREDLETIENSLKPIKRIFSGKVYCEDTKELPVWEDKDGLSD